MKLKNKTKRYFKTYATTVPLQSVQAIAKIIIPTKTTTPEITPTITPILLDFDLIGVSLFEFDALFTNNFASLTVSSVYCS